MFDFEGAIESGYTEDEVLGFLSEKNPKFNVKGAIESGYSPQEVSQFLAQPAEEKKEERGLLEKGARTAGQFALGAAEMAALPYEVAVAPLASKEAMQTLNRQHIMEDIERLAFQKQTGVWDEADQQRFEYLQDLMKNPQKQAETVQTGDFSLQGLTEKATGIDLTPEDFTEKTARMVGFIKDPKKIKEAFKYGLNGKQIISSILPSPTEVSRGVGIEAGLKIAEDGDYGPIGTLGAMVVGDIAGSGIAGVGKSAAKFAKNPKQAMAEVAASFTNSSKKELQKEIIESFRKEGIQADLGTITDNNLVKMVQARMAQSGLVGGELEKFKGNLFKEIRTAYQDVAKGVGEMKYTSAYEAGQVTKELVESIRKEDLGLARDMYTFAEEALDKGALSETRGVMRSVNSLKDKLKPGKLKSSGQRQALSIINKIEQEVRSGQAPVKNLINNKLALNDIINYEVQGGTQQLLKGLVGELDRAIISHGKVNPTFSNAYIAANKRFSRHAKAFRNRDISRLLKEQDPTKVLKRMDSINGIKSLEKILEQSKEGKNVFEGLKRRKLEEMFSNSFVSNMEEQLKLGTFSNALKKGQNAEIAKELMGNRGYERLKRIQKNAGILNKTSTKFFNASQSGVVAADVAISAKYLNDIFHLVSGNPWPFAKTTGGFVAAKKLSSLMSDPEFLKRVEDVIIAGKKNSSKESYDALKKIAPYLKLLQEEESEDQR